MPKIIVSVLTGVALVAVGAIASAASTGSQPTAPAPVVAKAIGAQAVPVKAGNASGAQGGAGAAGANAQGSSVAGAVVSAAAAPKTVRTVQLTMPSTTLVGKTVNGAIKVTDVTGKASAPVSGANVALQVKRVGSKDFVDVATDVTSEGGVVPFTYTVTETGVFRAAYEPAAGKPVYSNTVSVVPTALVTWGARPAAAATKKAPTAFTFRISGAAATAGHLEYMAKGAKTWTKLKPAQLPSTDLLTQSIAFPSAGTYYVRGVSEATPSIGSGSTTTLTVIVR